MWKMKVLYNNGMTNTYSALILTSLFLFMLADVDKEKIIDIHIYRDIILKEQE